MEKYGAQVGMDVKPDNKYKNQSQLLINMDILSTLNKIRILLCLVFLMHSCASTKFDCKDIKVCIQVEHNLEVVSDFIFYSIGDVESVVNAGNLLGKLSGHVSNSDVQFDEQQPPTISDYETWTAWYTLNHNRLRYNGGKEVYLIAEEL